MRQHPLRPTDFLVPAAAAAFAALMAFGFNQAASAETRSFQLSNFDSIDASAGVHVILKQGPFAVSADEPQGRFDQLRLEVVNGKLFVGRKSNDGFRMGKGLDYTVTVTAPAYSGLGASSGASLTADALSAKKLDAAVSSGAHADLKGSCQELQLNTSSGSHFNGEALKCETATVAASSGSHADAFASRTATGAASSGAHVTFHGQPATVTKSASSGGSVSAR